MFRVFRFTLRSTKITPQNAKCKFFRQKSYKIYKNAPKKAKIAY